MVMVLFLNNQKELFENRHMLADISLFEMFIFGGLLRNPYGKDVESKKYVPGKGWDVKSFPLSGNCSPDWIKSSGETNSPLSDALRVISAVNAILLMRFVLGTVLPPGWLEAFQAGGYFDGCVPAFETWLLYWGHKKSEDPEKTKVWFSEAEPPEDFSGVIIGEDELLQHWWLPASTPFGEFFRAVATAVNTETGSMTLYNTLEVLWEEGRVFFPGYRREGRFRYTVKSEKGTTYSWIKGEGQGDLECLGNVLFWWVLEEAPLSYISSLLNRDSTNLVAPNRVYGNPSPLNKASDRDTVGHLMVRTGCPRNEGDPTVIEFFNDTSPYAAAEAAKFAFQEGLPVLFQHQLESLRVGLAAAGLGKSTFEMVLPALDPQTGSPTISRVRLSSGQFMVDKSAKLFNRDSLEFRCPPLLEVDMQVPEEGAQLMESFNQMVDELLK